MKLFLKIAVLTGAFTGMALSLRAQEAVPPPMPAYQPLSGAQLDQLIGPIALYPDPLIAQILPASAWPEQIVLADRYVSGGGDPNQLDQQPWDASVQALARYPNVLQWMDDNLDWTTEVGQAFLNQPQDVMDSIQRLRWSAYNLGNLLSTPQQQVINDGGYIEIVPVEAQVIYVPVYQPDQVYFARAGGSPFITFGIGCPVGAWLDFDFDWGHHNLIVWNHDHPRPANWWHQASRQRNWGHTTVWHPGNRPGAIEVNRGDRGWGNNPVVRPAAPTVAHIEPVRRVPPPVQRPVNVRPVAPARVQPAAPVNRPETHGAFIGIQSSRDTRAYSNRGQQSMQTITHSAPVAHSAPVSRPVPVSRPATPSGGGGGSHNSGSSTRH